jgi:hypothetical protein
MPADRRHTRHHPIRQRKTDPAVKTNAQRPKTPEGRHRIRLALLKHGRYTKRAKQERLEWGELVRTSMELLYEECRDDFATSS